MKKKVSTLAAVGLSLGFLLSVCVSPAFAVSSGNPSPKTSYDLFGWFDSSPKAEQIVLGDYKDTMVVGSTQYLTPTVLPEGCTDTPSFVSENPNVVAVGEGGYIGAMAEGTTRVAVVAGEAVNYYTITVIPDPSTVVSALDLSAANTTLSVGETVSLSVSVLPTSASVVSMNFQSSDESVATVTNFGKVTGVSAGNVTITASIGDVTASIDLKVAVSTDSISVDEAYLVMKPGNTHTIKATVSPKNAPSSLTYSSLDSSVAKVSSKGVITAVKVGSTSVIVSNGSQKAVISVFVNQNVSSSGDSSSSPETAQEDSPSDSVLDSLFSDTESTDLTVSQTKLPVITSDVLNELCETDKNLTVTASDYTIRLNGADIKNTSNELDTDLQLRHDGEDVVFVLNQGQNLPGKVQLTVDAPDALYLYMYNESLGKWQKLDDYSEGILLLDTAGTYKLTSSLLVLRGINWWIVAACGVVLVAVIIVYIFVKRKYWFW